MSKTITQANLDANVGKTYRIDDFRSMVNYVNPKNKGYVRFTKGSDGKLSIQKINNKIDVPLSWRSNVKPEHNKAIRETFARAMSSDLRYMGAKADDIKNLILRPVVDGKAVAGKALSRLDVKQVFDKFDKEFNTVTGRENIINNFLAEAMGKAGYTGSDRDEFLRDYLQCGKAGIHYKLTDYVLLREEKDLTPEEIAAGGLEKLPPNKKMLVSEGDFRSLICQLEGMVAAAALRVQMVSACKSLARALVANPGAFEGEKIPEDDLSKVRGSLFNLLKAEGIADVDLKLKVGGGNPGLETFIGTVLPAMIRQAVENVFDFANTNDPKSVDQVLDADLNVDTILDTAKSFMEGAKKAVDNASLDGKSPDEAANALRNKLNQALSLYCKIDVRNVAIQAAKTIGFRQKGVATKLIADIQNELTDSFVKEIALENYAIDFIAEKFGKVENPGKKAAVGANGKPDHTAVAKKAAETVNNIKIAAQLVWGEMLSKPGAGGKEIYYAGGSAGEFIDAMEAKAVEIANSAKGGMPLYKNLLGGTLANIVNAKIRNAKAGGIETNINMRPDSYQAAFDQMELAAKAWRKFSDEKKDVIVGKARSAFLTQLNRLVKKNNITDEDRALLIADFDVRMEEAVKRAEERFFREKTPLPGEANADDAVKTGADTLAALLGEEKGDVVDDMKRRIAITVVAHKMPYKIGKDVMDVPAHVEACRSSLAEKKIAFKGSPDDVSVNLALTKLYYSVLEKKLEEKKIDPKKDGTDFVKKIQSSFVDAAKKFVANYNKAVDMIDRDALAVAKDGIEDELFGHPDFVEYKTLLKKDAFNAMRDSMAADLVIAVKPKIDAMKRLFLEHPETYAAKEISEDSTSRQIFPGKGGDYTKTDENRYHIYSRMVIARANAVSEWIARPNGAGSVNNLSTQLAADTTRRVTGEAGDRTVSAKLASAAKSLPANELGNIVGAAVKEVVAAAEKFAISYASGGRKAFLDRVAREVNAIVDKRVAEYAEFRRQFVPLAEKAMAKYPSLGRENLDAKLAGVLDAASREKTVPKANAFAVAFDGMLSKMVTDKIVMKEDEFLRYSAKVTEAYEKCVKVFNEKMKEAEASLAADGATEEDLAYMRETLMPVFRANLETDIQNNPDSYLRVNKEANVDFGVKLAELKAESAVKSMKYGLSEMNLTTDTGLLYVLNAIGLREFLYDDATKQIAKDTIGVWLKGDDAAKAVAEARRAEMTLAAYGKDSPCAAVAEAKAKIEAFRKSLRDHLVGIRTAALQGDFSRDQVEPAVALFKSWLARYSLPKITVSSVTYGTGTIEELAVAHFRTRIADLKQKIAASAGAGTAGEALLSPEYVRSLVKFINGVGLSAYIVQRKDEIVKARRDEIVSRGENMNLYDMGADGDLSDVQRDIRHLNIVGLTAILTGALDQASRAMHNKVRTMEDVARWGDMIEEEFNKAVADNSEQLADFDRFAKSRVAMMSVIDYVSNDMHMDRYVDEALKARFGVDILAEGALKRKFAAKRGADVRALVDKIKESARKEAAAAVASLKADAFSIPKPGEILPKLPTNGIEDGLGGKYNILTDVFKGIASGAVKAVETMKKQPEGKLFEEISKEIVK